MENIAVLSKGSLISYNRQTVHDTYARVLIVERSAFIRDAIQRMIKALPCVTMTAGADCISKALRILNSMPLDVMLLGTSTSPEECLRVTKVVKQHHPHTGVVAFVTDAAPEIARLLDESGVHGLLDESATERDLEIAVKASAIGSTFRSRHIYEQITSPQKAVMLTACEMQVLSLLMEGDSNDCIGRKLCITSKTVEAHLTRIYRKLDVTSRVQAINRARELRLCLDN